MSLTDKDLQRNPLEEMGIFYGRYAATVENNADPEKAYRLKLKCPAIFGTGVSEWALPCGVPSYEGLGFFILPAKGDNVWLSFQSGDVTRPIWEYGAFRKNTKPNSLQGREIVIVGRQGAQITLKTDGRIEIKAGELSLKGVLSDLVATLQTATSPPPTYIFDPNTQTSLIEIATKIQTLLA